MPSAVTHNRRAVQISLVDGSSEGTRDWLTEVVTAEFSQGKRTKPSDAGYMARNAFRAAHAFSSSNVADVLFKSADKNPDLLSLLGVCKRRESRTY